MKIQEFVKQIDGVSNSVWHYDTMVLEVFISEKNWALQNQISYKIFHHIESNNLLANFETVKFVMVL